MSHLLLETAAVHISALVQVQVVSTSVSTSYPMDGVIEGRSRGKQIWIKNGFAYHRTHWPKRLNRQYFSCATRRDVPCTGRVVQVSFKGV